jgi:hypothetical protein
VLRRQDGAFVAAFSARSATKESIVKARRLCSRRMTLTSDGQTYLWRPVLQSDARA